MLRYDSTGQVDTSATRQSVMRDRFSISGANSDMEGHLLHNEFQFRVKEFGKDSLAFVAFSTSA